MKAHKYVDGQKMVIRLIWLKRAYGGCCWDALPSTLISLISNYCDCNQQRKKKKKMNEQKNCYSQMVCYR